MKFFLLTILTAFVIFSCKKSTEFNSSESAFLENIKVSLKDSLSKNDYANIDIAKSVVTKLKDGRSFLRIPFKEQELSKEFVLLQIHNSGKIIRGFIINLLRNEIEKGKEYEFNGYIIKSSLNRKLTSTSVLINGVITHHRLSGVANKPLVVPGPKDTTIIIIGEDVPPYGDAPISYSDWISVTGVFGYSGLYGADGAYLYAGYYNSGADFGHSQNLVRTPGKNGSIVDTFQIASPVLEIEPLFADIEFVEDLSPIDATKFIKCFSNVPDEGSTCSVEILTDIPVDGDPNKLFNWQTQSPGHTFLQLKKTNGNLAVMQNIGFYPSEGWKTILTTAPVEGKFVDNGEHEFNASLKMNLTPQDFKKTLDEIAYLAGTVKYDIDEFNCTDFALDVFNRTRVSNPLEISRYDIPGGTAISGSNTPQGLFNKLKGMQDQGIEADNINIPGYKGFVASSDGPCN